MFKSIAGFEDMFSRTYGVPYVLALNSGAAALLAALLSLKVPRSKSVLVPAYSWPQAASVPRALGYRVTCVDVDSSGCLDLADLQKKMNNRAGALIVTHLFGNPSPVSSAVIMADAEGVPVIEDCSQSLFARDNGRYTGTWGAFGFCSTGANKHLSTGEGGLLWTFKPGLYQEAYAFSQHVEREAPYWLRERTLLSSLSLRMHPQAAGRGIKSLAALPARLHDHSALCEKLRVVLRGLYDVRLPQVAPGCKAVWQHCPVLGNPITQETLSRFWWDRHPAYLTLSSRSCPGARLFARQVRFLNIYGGDCNGLLDEIVQAAQ